MKAVVLTEFGSPDVLRLAEVEKPAPKDNEVRVRVFATPVNFGDTLARDFKSVTPGSFSMPGPLWLPTKIYFGFNKPKINILGSEFSGEVEAVGQDVALLKPGDAVFGYRGQAMGANAEYVCMAENGAIAPKPANLGYEEAAAIPYGGLTALNLLRKLNVQSGQKVLINGASGSIGSFALQLAKHYGAEVTGVCSTPRVDMVKALGADHVIDYTKEDFTQSGTTYDLILDILGKSSFAACKPALTPNGCYALASFKMKHLFQMLWTSGFSDKKVKCVLSTGESADDFMLVKELAEAGTIKAIIDRTFPLEQTAEAHRYVEAGGKTGSVVITVAQPVQTA